MTPETLKTWRQSLPPRDTTPRPGFAGHATQDDAAFLLGITRATYEKWERGAATIPAHVPIMVNLYNSLRRADTPTPYTYRPEPEAPPCSQP